jgi:hypothetical protein
MVRTKMSDADMAKVTSDTKSLLDEQEKVRIKLFLEPEEKKRLEAAKENGKDVQWPNEFVGINGYNYHIPRGIEVEVPVSVKEVLENAGMI